VFHSAGLRAKKLSGPSWATVGIPRTGAGGLFDPFPAFIGRHLWNECGWRRDPDVVRRTRPRKMLRSPRPPN